QRACQRTRDLRHLDRMGQPLAIMVALMGDENLRLVLQATKGGGMDDAVAVALEGRARRAFGFRVKTAARAHRVAGIGRAGPIAEADLCKPCGHCTLPLRPVDLPHPASYLLHRTQRKVTAMGVDAKSDMKGVELTDAAARRIAAIVESETGKIALRVAVEGGGCSGFSYSFDLVDSRNDDDIAIEKDGATVL